ncbi:MAG: amidophosphoribosyltransferase [Desulfobacterales bacterium]|nr:amidophosphoribosyltransferase [Desulfobacterales bacterium]
MICDKFKDECGVLGIYSTASKNLARRVAFGLISLQHRGQESAGIASYRDGKVYHYKEMGLVQDVFNNEILEGLKGHISVGHVRYSTTGESHVSNAQPLVIKYRGENIALAHNGNLINADKIRDKLEESGSIFQTSIDTEVIANLMAKNYSLGFKDAILKTVHEIKGAFALVIICEGKLIGVRDPNGLRPLCIGKLPDGGLVLTSESCALDVVGAELVRDVKNGEMVIIDENGMESILYDDTQPAAHCIFEYVYFARPDSVIDTVSVSSSRRWAGKLLAKEHPVEADIVIAVPDSGIDAAIGYAQESGIPYGIGLIKNKYIGRTFIQPDQETRELAVRLKLNVLKETVKGKRVVVIDDSIVRGTTSKKIVDALRKAGASEVHMRVSSSSVKYPCFFGIDTPNRQQLVSSFKSNDEVKEIIGADTLGYISVEGLLESVGKANCDMCTACFDGDYPMDVPEEVNKNMFD